MKKLKITAVLFVLMLLAVSGCAPASKPFEIKELTIDQVAEKMEKGETFVLQVERDNCPFCEAANAYIEKTKDEHPDTVLYRLDSTDFKLMREQEGDMTLISQTENGQKFLGLFPYFLYTPTLYAVIDGKPYSAGIGYDEQNNTVSQWDTQSTIDWNESKPVDIWSFIDLGKPADQTKANTGSASDKQEAESSKDQKTQNNSSEETQNDPAK